MIQGEGRWRGGRGQEELLSARSRTYIAVSKMIESWVSLDSLLRNVGCYVGVGSGFLGRLSAKEEGFKLELIVVLDVCLGWMVVADGLDGVTVWFVGTGLVGSPGTGCFAWHDEGKEVRRGEGGQLLNRRPCFMQGVQGEERKFFWLTRLCRLGMARLCACSRLSRHASMRHPMITISSMP